MIDIVIDIVIDKVIDIDTERERETETETDDLPETAGIADAGGHDRDELVAALRPQLLADLLLVPAPSTQDVSELPCVQEVVTHFI